MKVFVAADIHARRWKFQGRYSMDENGSVSHTRVARTIEMLTLGVQQAHAMGCRTAVFSGDFLDEGQTIDPFLQTFMLGWVQWLKSMGWVVIMEVGNHERSSKTYNIHALNAFRSCAVVVDKFRVINIGDYAAYFLPFQYHPQEDFEKFRAQIAADEAMGMTRAQRVVFAHYPVKEACDASGRHFGVPLSVYDFQPDKFQWVILGDIHKEQHLLDNALYTGAPIPQTFNELNNSGCFYVFDFDKGTAERLIVKDPNPFYEVDDYDEFQSLKKAGRNVRLKGSKISEVEHTTSIRHVATLNQDTLPEIISSYVNTRVDVSVRNDVAQRLRELICTQSAVPEPTPVTSQGR